MKVQHWVWRQAWGELAEQLFDLFTALKASSQGYPVTPSVEALVEDRFSSLDLPSKSLVRMEQLSEEEWAQDGRRKVADWATMFQYEILKGIGDDLATNLGGVCFERLKELTRVWGSHLAGLLGRVLKRLELVEAIADVWDAIGRQLPAEVLGEVFKESFTPQYLKAQASVQYALALFAQDSRKIQEAEQVLQASEHELKCEIDSEISRTSTKDLGKYVRQLMLEIASLFRELSAVLQREERWAKYLPRVFQTIAWYIGYKFHCYAVSHPQRVREVLEAVEARSEIEAFTQQYKFLYGWAEDGNNAIRLAWQAVARKYFLLDGRANSIHRDEDQEKLVGVASGLKTYCDKNWAMVALLDGVSGGLGAYLAKAAKNRETDYVRRLVNEGNKVLTEAKHVADYRTKEEDPERSDEEILSELSEKLHPSSDPTADQVETKETFVAWLRSLTEEELTVVNLRSIGKSEEEIAEEMGISQPRVSQLLGQSWRKYQKIR